MSVLSRLTWIQRITIILFVVVVGNWIIVSATGYGLLGGDLFTIFLIVFLVLLGAMLLRPLLRRVF